MLDQAPGVPVTATETASLPRQRKRSLHELGQYFHQQYDQGCVYRHRKHLAFMFIQSYLRMIHFFGVTRYGQWQPIPPEKDKIRAAVPVMLPMYQHILGILNSNQIGVTVTPLATTSTGYRDKARAEAAILGWQHEADFISTFDRANQFLLSEGTVGLITHFPSLPCGRASATAFPQPPESRRVFPVSASARFSASLLASAEHPLSGRLRLSGSAAL